MVVTVVVAVTVIVVYCREYIILSCGSGGEGGRRVGDGRVDGGRVNNGIGGERIGGGGGGSGRGSSCGWL